MSSLQSDSKRRAGLVLLVGAFYFVAGTVLGEIANRAGSHQMRVAWRLSAWLVSGIAFAAHIAYERLRLGRSTPATALRASLAAALGSFVLAVAATVRAVWFGADNLHLYAIALVAWPGLTMVPAFLVALAAAAVLARSSRRGPS